MIRLRLRSPLRWLSATMSALMIFGLAGIFSAPWLLLAAPLVSGAFLLAPPLGVYRHDEIPKPITTLRLSATPLEPAANALRFRLTLHNDGDERADDFRIRLLVPHTLVPAEAARQLLPVLHLGALGRNWFIETIWVATAITFRAAPKGHAETIACPPHGQLELADLALPSDTPAATLDYQLSGGTARPVLGTLRLDDNR